MVIGLVVGTMPLSSFAVDNGDKNPVSFDELSTQNNMEFDGNNQEKDNKNIDSDENNYEENFNVLLSGILTDDNSSFTYENVNEILKEKPTNQGIWISEQSREFLLSLINNLTNENYMISNGYLGLDNSNIKSDEYKKPEYNYYTNKINQLIDSDKTVVLSIETTYSTLNPSDNSIMSMHFEEGDYANRFVSETQNCDVVVLNEFNYNDKNEDNSKSFLMNRLLEVYYGSEADFLKGEVEKPEVSESYENIEYDDIDTTVLPEEDILETNGEIELNAFDVALSGVIGMPPISIETIQNINNQKPSEKGIWVAESARSAVLSYINNHCIYTYSFNENGYIVCDNVMKEFSYNDCQSETEVDIVLRTALNVGITIIITADDSYLTYDEGTIKREFLTSSEYTKVFDDNTMENRILLLNDQYFNDNLGYNLAMSDRFAKAILSRTGAEVSTLDVGDVSGKVISGTTVYAGPSGSNYATVGSVGTNELVAVYGQSAGWAYIGYLINGTITVKSGYIPMSNVKDIDGAVYEESYYSGALRFSNSTVKVKSIFASSMAVDMGTIYAGEGFTELSRTVDYIDGTSMSYVEYSTPSGTKRGYIYANNVVNASNYPNSCVARVISVSCPAYSGPDNSYTKLGGVYFNEFVAVLARQNGQAFVEYNTKSGRKRGYMNEDSLYLYKSLANDDFSTHKKIVKATQGLTVYGGPNNQYANIGSISNQERVSFHYTENEFSYIEYSTANGSKRGYVLSAYLVDSVPVVLPNIPLYSNFTVGNYGTSGNGRALNYYKIGNGPNVAFAVFAQHGWEDAWASDGIELVNIANSMMSSLSANDSKFASNWTVYVVPYANPDGIVDGYTNNGAGRCTVSTKVDMNRCWPANFTPYYTSRNYTGSSPLGAPEASSLKNLISSKFSSSGTNVVLDIHGWLNKTYGSSEVGAYFDQQFGYGHNNTHGAGYLETWATQQGAKACLIELPMPSSSQSIVSNNYAGKLTNGFPNLMTNMSDGPIVEGGTQVNELVRVTTTSSVRLRSGPGTSYPIVTSLTDGAILTRVKKGVAIANGYTWDKVALDDVRVGYMATNYLTYVSEISGYEKFQSYDEIQAVKAYLRYETSYGANMVPDSEFNIELVGQLEEYQKSKNFSVQDGSLNKETLMSMGFSIDSIGKIYKNEFYNKYVNIAKTYLNGDRLCYKDEVNNIYSFNGKETKTDDEYNKLKTNENEKFNTMPVEEKYEKEKDMAKLKVRIDRSVEQQKSTFPHAAMALGRFVDTDKLGQDLDFGDLESLFSVNAQRDLMMKFTERSMRLAQDMSWYGVNNFDFAIDKYINASVPAKIDINTPFERIDWFMAANAYKLGLKVKNVIKNGNAYSMSLTFSFLDYYDWGYDDDAMTFPIGLDIERDPVTGKLMSISPDLVNEKELYDLHRAGIGENFESHGEYKVIVNWNGGDSVDKAVIIKV